MTLMRTQHRRRWQSLGSMLAASALLVACGCAGLGGQDKTPEGRARRLVARWRVYFEKTSLTEEDHRELDKIEEDVVALGKPAVPVLAVAWKEEDGVGAVYIGVALRKMGHNVLKKEAPQPKAGDVADTAQALARLQKKVSGEVQPLRSILDELWGDFGLIVYMSEVEQLYESGHRDVVFEFLDITERELQARGEDFEYIDIEEFRRAIWRHELDLDALRRSVLAELNAAILKGDKSLPRFLLDDSWLRRTELPRYAAYYRRAPQHEGLFALLASACKGRDKDWRPLGALCRLRLGAVPEDKVAADKLLLLWWEKRKFALLADGGDRIPIPVRDLWDFPRYRMRALIALERMEEAISVGETIEKDIAKTGWNKSGRAKRLAEFFAEAGRKDKALALIELYPIRRSYERAVALARYGAGEAALRLVEKAIKRDGPDWVLFRYVDACRLAGDQKRAEEIFDLAEQRGILQKPRWGPFPSYEVFLRYQKEGREERLFNVLLKARGPERAPYDSTVEALTKKKGSEAALAFLKKHLQANGKSRKFLLLYAQTLEKAKQFRKAIDYCRKAESLSKHSDDRDWPLVSCQIRCYRALGDVDACLAWLETRHADTPKNESVAYALKELYEERDLVAKAADVYGRIGRHFDAVRLLCQERSEKEATAYVSRLPEEIRAYHMRQIKEELGDAPALAEILKEQLKTSPKSGRRHAELGRCLLEAGKIEEGRRHQREAIRLGYGYDMLSRLEFDPHPSCITFNERPSYERVACVYLAAGLKKELEADFAPLIGRTNAHRVVHLGVLVKFQIENGRAKEPIQILFRLKKMNPYGIEWYDELIERAEKKPRFPQPDGPT